MRSNPDGEYNWILNYQDHFTKWIMLRPLKRKCAVEVASTLVSVFYTLGAPCILQSDNGKEFDNHLLLVTLNQLWPPTKIIHGKPQHPQSQGSVESANKRVENILTSLLDKFQHSNWRSPRGLGDFHLPEELHRSINDIEDIKVLNPDIGNEPGDQLENILESHSDTSMMKEEYETEFDSDEYDIEMNIDAKSLGASVYTHPDSRTCKVCKLSVGGERVFCDGCSSIGHKHCFITLSPLRGQSRKYTNCKKLQCTGKLQHKQTQLAVQRAQKVQADKMLLNTALTLPLLSLGIIKNKCLCRGNCATKHCPCKVSGCYCTSGCHPKSNSTCKNSDNRKALLGSHKLKSKVTSTIRKKSPKKSHSSTIPLGEVINKNILEKSSHCYSLNVHLGEILDLAPSLTQLETLCVMWGGEYNGIQLINTCPIDNFLTLISLQIDPIGAAFGYLQKELGTEINEFLTKIQLGKFDLLRYIAYQKRCEFWKTSLQLTFMDRSIQW
ncbi:KRAB-A domain-containing protein 2-like [Oopsacas minuta]|uniref:KRAB-A domain-containing protein 2-like n=1 Tax=Oopsacas minuta TaxID=111878 RepID=A0AAV7KH37_9METZ|nr:KRAB-A domain-containing protein 2-like [Oopsacas minuta]